MKMTEHQLMELDNENAGYCHHCDEVTRDSGVEPDAEGYECPKCGEFAVMGMQQAVLLEKIDLC